jgi:hypothetical protein
MTIKDAYKKMLKGRVITADGCWLYNTSTVRGKREIYVAKGNRLVARVSGCINLGLDIFSHDLICHNCKEDNCWNPDHIYIGNTSSNTIDSIKNGTHFSMYRGITHCKYGHKLSGSNLYEWKDRNGQHHRWCKICRNKLANASK